MANKIKILRRLLFWRTRSYKIYFAFVLVFWGAREKNKSHGRDQFYPAAETTKSLGRYSTVKKDVIEKDAGLGQAQKGP